MDTKIDAPSEPRPRTPIGPETTVPRRRAVLGAITAVSLVMLVIAALFVAPEDAAQGAAQRIFYIHVPSAWVGFLAFLVVFVASIRFLRTGDRRFDDIASASAAVGMVFTTAVLITGPLWGRAAWGVYWTWDPRLTSFLLLWLIYLSYLVLRGYVPEPERRARYSAVVGIVGFLDVPIVYLSVRWWRAQHPSQLIFTRGGLPPSMLVVLLIGVAAFTLLYLYLLSVRLRVSRLDRDREEVPA